MRDGDMRFLALALLIALVRVYALSQVYRSCIRGFGGDVRRGSALRISMTAFSMLRIIPGGAAAGSAWAAREFVAVGNPAARTVVAMTTTWWVSMTSLAMLVTGAVGASVASGAIPAPYLVGPALSLAGLLAAGLLAGSRDLRSRGRLGRRSQPKPSASAPTPR